MKLSQERERKKLIKKYYHSHSSSLAAILFFALVCKVGNSKTIKMGWGNPFLMKQFK